ncbi:MAG: membrane protein insertase YidC [Bacteroidia bacterium]
MDRNVIFGLILIVTIIFTFNMMNSGEEAKSAEAPKKEAVKVKPTADSVKKATVIYPTNDSSFVWKKDQISYTFSTLGGKIKSVELHQFKTYSKKPLVLFFNQKIGYEFDDKGVKTSTSTLLFSPNVENDKIIFTAMTPKGTTVKHIFQNFKKDGSNEFIAQIEGNTSNSVVFSAEMTTPPQEKDLEEERFKSTIHYSTTEGEHDYINERKEDTENLEEKLKWISFKQKYFNSSFVFSEGINNAQLTTKNGMDSSSVKTMSLKGEVPLKNGQVSLVFHFGPSKFYDLKEVGYGLENQVYLGWNLLSVINEYVILPIFTIINKTGWGFGLIILILSIIIKAILFPLTYKSTLSTVKMRILKPEIDAIKEKIGEDQMKLQAETMKLYSKAGVNPLGGCLPLILQMPLLFAMFYFFPAVFELRGESFLWAEDLSTYDSLIHWETSIPVLGTHLSLFTILMTISTLIYTKIQNEVSGATGQMKYIGYIMPVIFLGVLNSYASGLTYYYLLLNLITFAQQAILKRSIDENKLHAQIAENKQKGGKTKSKFQQRLEEMQAAQNKRKK